MDPAIFYFATIKCIACNSEFKSPKIKHGKAKVTRRDEDLCPWYEGVNPLFYDFTLCPNCGTVFMDKIKAQSVAEKTRLIQTFKSIQNAGHLADSERNLEDARRLAKLTLLAINNTTSGPAALASVAMRISWFARYVGDAAEEEKFMKVALDNYEKTFVDGDGEFPMDNLLYIMGELTWRLGNYDGAKQWFGKLFGFENPKSPMVKKGKERWYDIREARRREGQEE
ncbi:MAG: hypothetical protein CVV64_09850 [Candidatus Wallbacteria bacterium HGW-Wallbacteria-1]|jgi:hypothetical protein|uniref:DUF2225 domain-containing protein n=1 Tax=Candidatus Wallbacteria bacterium HGW-Wallbacteria-1 TaxID=2013854 RepID=A0A2N1PPJ5_9BACT|nr:MAG: hypothetical protein CVV64_09850 [Candidatus Wallbacteria bacterium HGW-Wallbacteria-1]